MSSTNHIGFRPNWLSSKIAIPSSVNAIIIVCSRPSLSDTQPKNGRLTPLRTRFIDSANGKASNVTPNNDTGESEIPKSLAIGVNCAVAMSPPVAVNTNMMNITQNAGVRSISIGVCSRPRTADVPTIGVAREVVKAASGARRNQLTRNTTAPCAIPNLKNVVSYPCALIMLAIGNTVSADPAPNPIAVIPAASPRRSGNHLSALPTHAPYTAPAPMPPTTAPR